MRKIYDRLRGTARAEICGAFPEAVLNACALGSVVLWGLECVNEYTIRVSVHENELDALRAAAQEGMCELSVLEKTGGSKNRAFIVRRAWLLISALAVALLLAASSLFIWQIDIRGCRTLTEGQVLRALSDCGVSRGCFWPSLSADLVRSRMMTLLPQIGWMTVNVSGSRAIVLVSEREEKPEIYLESAAADIVAGRTGIVTQLSVLSGRPLVSPGQSVLEGETLVSGVMESLSNPPRYVCARARVMAVYRDEIPAVCPLEQTLKTEKKGSWSRFALKIGKNRINFYFSGGKDIDGCDKIVHEYNLGVEGLFALPVTIVREELQRWETAPGSAADAEPMKRRLYEALCARIDGEIVTADYSVAETGGLLCVTLRARCRENIARSTDITEETGALRAPS